MKLHKGQYFYAPRGRNFQIYRHDGGHGNGISSSSPIGETYFSRSEAYARVCELHGWTQKERKA